MLDDHVLPDGRQDAERGGLRFLGEICERLLDMEELDGLVVHGENLGEALRRHEVVRAVAGLGGGPLRVEDALGRGFHALLRGRRWDERVLALHGLLLGRVRLRDLDGLFQSERPVLAGQDLRHERVVVRRRDAVPHRVQQREEAQRDADGVDDDADVGVDRVRFVPVRPTGNGVVRREPGAVFERGPVGLVVVVVVAKQRREDDVRNLCGNQPVSWDVPTKL
mmetsp:Transcript_18751/g.61403  ORF Transcript_18751/g.61403 Transcript_18751/m.61403 type:complete len:223 (-) Transcript_18751:9-677(-)